MTHLGLDGVNPLHVELRVLPQGLGRLARHFAEFRQRLGGHQLDLEPLAVLVLIRPDAA